jgi:hypothetical protein
MMPYWLIELLRYSILLAAVLAILRYQKTDTRYYPFFYLIWIGVINEIISTILVQNGYYNIINSTIYSFIEAILILLLFYKFNLYSLKIFYFLLLIISAAYVVEEMYIRFQAFNSYSRIIKGFILVLCSISMINKLLVEEKYVLIKNPMFIISVCFLLYFLMGIVVESFYVYTLPFTSDFRKKIFAIMMIINLIINFIYAYSFLLMPAKKHDNFKQVHYV